MEKSIRVSEETHQRLFQLRLDLRATNLDEVIRLALDSLEKDRAA